MKPHTLVAVMLLSAQMAAAFFSLPAAAQGARQSSAQNPPRGAAAARAPAQVRVAPAIGIGESLDEEGFPFSYQLPDFSAGDGQAHIYKIGFFSANGTGNGTAFPDESGLIQESLPRSGIFSDTDFQAFVYAIDATTGAVKMYMDLTDITANKAAQLLTNVEMNARSALGGDPLQPWERITAPLPAGDERKLDLRGEGLSIDDVLDQIYLQTRCDVVEKGGLFTTAACN